MIVLLELRAWSKSKPELGFREEVGSILKDPTEGVEGYRIPRKNLIYGKWINSCGLYPDFQERLFRREHRYIERKVHARVDLKSERTGELKHHLIHHDLTDLHSYHIKFARYMNYELDQLVKEGREFRLREITLRPIYMFGWSYFYKQGFRAGIRGFLLSVLHAYYNFTMYMKLWEHEQR